MGTAWGRGHCSDHITAMEMLEGNNLSGQTHVVSGGNSGIAFSASLALAAKNASVIILPHNRSKGEAAVDKIRTATANNAVWSFPMELASFASVRTAARTVQEVTASRISSLILVAGSSAGPKGAMPPITDDGFNYVIQANYLGHVLLTNLLLPALRGARPAGRVIWVASAFKRDGGCATAKLAQGCLSLANLERTLRTTSSKFIPSPTAGIEMDGMYFVSKWLDSIHAAALARKEAAFGSGVVSYSLVPGDIWSPLVMNTGVDLMQHRKNFGCKGEGTPEHPNAGCRTSSFLTADQGASALVHLAARRVMGRTGLANSGDRFSFCNKCTCPIDIPVGRLGASSDYLDGLIHLTDNLTGSADI